MISRFLYLSLIFFTLACGTNTVIKSSEKLILTNISNPDSVFVLNLNGKKLKVFPVEVFEFKNLKELNISKNKIEEIPAAIKNLKKLEVLNIANNKLESLNEEVVKLPNLKKLLLYNNLIDTIPDSFIEKSKLEHIDFGSNELGYLPKSIINLKNLKILDLKGIQFTNDERHIIKILLPNVKINYSTQCNCLD